MMMDGEYYLNTGVSVIPKVSSGFKSKQSVDYLSEFTGVDGVGALVVVGVGLGLVLLASTVAGYGWTTGTKMGNKYNIVK